MLEKVLRELPKPVSGKVWEREPEKLQQALRWADNAWEGVGWSYGYPNINLKGRQSQDQNEGKSDRSSRYGGGHFDRSYGGDGQSSPSQRSTQLSQRDWTNSFCPPPNQH